VYHLLPVCPVHVQFRIPLSDPVFVTLLFEILLYAFTKYAFYDRFQYYLHVYMICHPLLFLSGIKTSLYLELILKQLTP
jgi:hypothetical protein